MNRLATVLVVCMILVAGCSGGPVSDEGDGNGESGNVVTYTNESNNTTFKMVVDHDSKTYDMFLNSTLEPPYDTFSRNVSIGFMCAGLEQATYNRSANVNGTVEDTDTYTKTTANGDTTTVTGIPEEVFQEYEPQGVKATTYAQNGTVLDRCAVTGKGDFSFS